MSSASNQLADYLELQRTSHLQHQGPSSSPTVSSAVTLALGGDPSALLASSAGLPPRTAMNRLIMNYLVTGTYTENGAA